MHHTNQVQAIGHCVARCVLLNQERWQEQNEMILSSLRLTVSGSGGGGGGAIALMGVVRQAVKTSAGT